MSLVGASGKRRPSTLCRHLAQPVPASRALPWLFLLLLSPVWLLLFDNMVSVLVAVIHSAILPGSESLNAVENDLIVFWPASHLILTQHAANIYDPAWFSAWRATHLVLGVAYYLEYFYPPPALLLLLPIVPFGYFTAFLVWTILISAPAILLLRRAKVAGPILIIGLLSPAGIFTLRIGQFGILTGAILIAGLLNLGLDRKKSGFLLGLLSVKPQAGLLGPIAMLARGDYRSLAVALSTALGLGLAVTLLCGTAIWPAFIDLGLKQANRVLIARFPTNYEFSGASVFWLARSVGASVDQAGILQAISALCATIWCWFAWRRPNPDRIGLIALTTSLTLLVTPYAYTDDMWGFSLMVGWLAWERRRLEIPDVLMWMWPALCPYVAQAAHLELTPLILLLGALRAWKRLIGIGTPATACYPAPL